ncbi:hypothetical protein BC938DRAFT_475670 [Jimgerdemannia flammicorona]|uniref:J domain-containing protein n=1 Tax=Jimgerdemannia flammicorona TaxID=994334 RepID=A0A433PQK3_9FUNG|nr:hypothetical protein BC938DRAFT_475670 [Jimgerdemannia flammicorona]
MSTSNPLDFDPDADLYALLLLTKKATASEIKSAYRRLALQHHPDKQATTLTSDEKDTATRRFQQIGFAYAILSDDKRKAQYDRTGSTEDSGFLDDTGKDWDAYFKELWTGVVNAQTIEEFAKKYKGESPSKVSEYAPSNNIPLSPTESDEERRDLLVSYTQHSGSMDRILEDVMCSTVDDEPRFRTIITAAIAAKEVRSFKAFTAETPVAQARRKRAAEREAKEAEELAMELGVEGKLGKKGKGGEPDEDALKALILANRKRGEEAMDAVIENILEKEKAKKGAKGKAKKEPKKGRGVAKKGKSGGMIVEDESENENEPDEPGAEATEEEFLALQAKLFPGKSEKDTAAEDDEPEPATSKKGKLVRGKPKEKTVKGKKGEGEKKEGEPKRGRQEKDAAEKPAKAMRRKAEEEEEEGVGNGDEGGKKETKAGKRGGSKRDAGIEKPAKVTKRKAVVVEEESGDGDEGEEKEAEIGPAKRGRKKTKVEKKEKAPAKKAGRVKK